MKTLWVASWYWLEAMDKSQVPSRWIKKAFNASAVDFRLSLLDHWGCDKRDVFWDVSLGRMKVSSLSSWYPMAPCSSCVHSWVVGCSVLFSLSLSLSGCEGTGKKNSSLHHGKEVSCNETFPCQAVYYPKWHLTVPSSLLAQPDCSFRGVNRSLYKIVQILSYASWQAEWLYSKLPLCFTESIYCQERP